MFCRWPRPGPPFRRLLIVRPEYFGFELVTRRQGPRLPDHGLVVTVVLGTISQRDWPPGVGGGVIGLLIEEVEQPPCECGGIGSCAANGGLIATRLIVHSRGIRSWN